VQVCPVALPSARECSRALESGSSGSLLFYHCTYVHHHSIAPCTLCTCMHYYLLAFVHTCYLSNEIKSLRKSHKHLVETDIVSGEGGAVKPFPPRNVASESFFESLVFKSNKINQFSNQIKKRFLGWLTTNPGGDSSNQNIFNSIQNQSGALFRAAPIPNPGLW
jgi:hypothetical protein